MHCHAFGQLDGGVVLLGLVGDDDDARGAFRMHLRGNLRHRQRAVHRLAAGHGHRIVVEQLVGDVDLGRDRRADRQQARVVVRAVAQVGEHVRVGRERHLADPRHAFAAHLAEGVGAAVHPHRHVVTADAGQRARALGHVGRRVVRAARAEPRLALGGDAGLGQRLLLGVDDGDARFDAGAHVRRQLELLQPRGNGARDQRRGQLVMRRQQPVAHRHRPFAAGVVALVELAVHARTHVVAVVVQLFLELVFEDLALLFHHQDFLQPFGEGACAVRLQRPHAADLVQADADAAAGLVIEAQVDQRLAHVQVGLAGGHDAEARLRRIEHHAVELVGAHIGQARVPLVVEQAGFLHQRRIGPADVQAARRHDEVFGQHDLGAVRIDIDRGRRFHHVRHALHRYPQAGVAAHRPAVQAVVEILLHVGRIQHRNAGRLEHVFRLVRQRRGLAGMIVTRQHQDPAVRGRAGRVGVLEHVDGAVHAGPLAVPHAEHAVEPGRRIQVDLLRAPDRRGGQVFIEPRLEDDAVAGQMRLGLPQGLVQRPQRRAAVAGDEAGGVQPRSAIALLLQHRQPHQRLRPADIDAAALQRVFVVQGNGFERAA